LFVTVFDTREQREEKLHGPEYVCAQPAIP
jgi:hypothetical protein